MRLSPILKVLVGFATLFPFLALLLPPVFMAFLSLGLWDPVAHFLLARVPSVTLESIAWNAALALGSLLLILHPPLIAFYIYHIITNYSSPRNVRIAFGLALFIFPFIAMTAYYFTYILPADPPIWARPPSRGHASLPLPQKPESFTPSRLTARWSRPGQLRPRLIWEYPRAGRAAHLEAVRRR